ncbi:MAG: nitroreductase family protein, partial [Acidianus hospitalis]
TVLAIENLWLAARAENLGMGWVSFLDKNKIKEILGIPSNVEFIAYLTLGYVTKFPERPELEEKGWNYRLPLSEVVFEDRWGNKPNEKLLEKLNSAKI